MVTGGCKENMRKGKINLVLIKRVYIFVESIYTFSSLAVVYAHILCEGGFFLK